MRERAPSKPEIAEPLSVFVEVDGNPQRMPGSIVRLSLVGADIETASPLPLGATIVLHTQLDPRVPAVSTLRGRVQWARGACVGVQFGPLGVRETVAVLGATRARGASAGEGLSGGGSSSRRGSSSGQ